MAGETSKDSKWRSLAQCAAAGDRISGRSSRGGTGSDATPAAASLQLVELVVRTIADTATRLGVHMVHHAADAPEDGSRLQ